MNRKEKIGIFILCCITIIFITLSRLSYNFCMSKGVEYILKYIAISWVSTVAVFICWVILCCFMLCTMLWLFCIWCTRDGYL